MNSSTYNALHLPLYLSPKGYRIPRRVWNRLWATDRQKLRSAKVEYFRIRGNKLETITRDEYSKVTKKAKV